LESIRKHPAKASGSTRKHPQRPEKYQKIFGILNPSVIEAFELFVSKRILDKKIKKKSIFLKFLLNLLF
jgi:hypothetical protein